MKGELKMKKENAIKIPVALKMDPDLFKKLKIHCINQELSIQDFVDQALRLALGNKNVKNI
jgi:hypothetical protein